MRETSLMNVVKFKEAQSGWIESKDLMAIGVILSQAL